MSERKIILAEEENIISLDIINFLKNNNFKVSATVKTGEELINECTLTEPDLVIIDLNLHGKIKIKELIPEITKKHSIPVIIISGSSQTKLKTYISNKSNIEVIEKPFERSELLYLANKFFK